jgi:hypothetical protein
VNSFQFACLLSLGIMLVFTGFLPPTSPRAHDTSDKLSAQGGRFASGGEAASFQLAEDVSIASPDEANVESPKTTKIKRSKLQTKLNAGDEVTTSTGSYGRVRSQEGSVVQVEIDGDVRQCARNTIHLRHWVTKAFFGLTNDRKQYARAKRTCLHVS